MALTRPSATRAATSAEVSPRTDQSAFRSGTVADMALDATAGVGPADPGGGAVDHRAY